MIFDNIVDLLTCKLRKENGIKCKLYFMLMHVQLSAESCTNIKEVISL